MQLAYTLRLCCCHNGPMSMRERSVFIFLKMTSFILISCGLFCGCTTVSTTPKEGVILSVNDRSVNLTAEKNSYSAEGLKIWLQTSAANYSTPFGGSVTQENKIIQNRRDSFLMYFKDDVDPYSNRRYAYSNCLVDINQPDRVLFFFGGEKTWHECLDKILPKKAVRIWKVCENKLYEVTATPVTEKDSVTLNCQLTKR